MVAMEYSQVEGVGYFETFVPTASATSNRLVVAMACKLDWGLRHLDVAQASTQSESDTDIWRLPPGCESIIGEVVRLNKAFIRPQKSGCAWNQLFLTLVKNGFEQCSVDPCVLRRIIAGDVVVMMMIFQMDGIRIARTEGATGEIVNVLNQRCPTKHLGEVGWYMNSVYKRDRENGAM